MSPNTLNILKDAGLKILEWVISGGVAAAIVHYFLSKRFKKVESTLRISADKKQTQYQLLWSSSLPMQSH